ncbi:MAG: ABC transporter substrate-binding protein [Caldisericia bacterium]|nr:ABC transporter substrate-binding protein [Caldisericia bacterium]
MKRLYSIVVSLLLCFILFVGCTSNNDKANTDILEPVSILLDWTPNTNHTGLVVALKKGFYRNQGLDVEIIQANEGGTSQLIGANQGTFGISYQEEVTFACEKEIPVKAIAAIIQHNTSGFASPAEKNIVTPVDFENRTYGGWGSPVEIATIKALMKKYDANFDSISIATIGATDFFTATQKDIDFTWIYYGWDGIAAENRNIDINFIDLGKENSDLDFYTPVIIANNVLLIEQPEMVKKFLFATQMGYEFCIENPEEAATILLEYAPELDSELVIGSQKWLASQYVNDSSSWGLMEKSRWDNYTEWLHENDLIERQVESNLMFTNEYLPK